MSKTDRAAEALAMRALELLPKNLVSRLFGAVAELELPRPLQLAVNEGFVRWKGLQMQEAERAASEYASLDALFTRRLVPGARPAESTEDQDLVSPVDGRLTRFGELDDGTLLQAKGRIYSLVELLDSAAQAERFIGGAWATIYLSPRDYHRIHSPARGRVTSLSYVPGHLWPVNPMSVRHVDRLFAVNERLISYMDTPGLGPVAVIKVGATCVGRIRLSFHGLESNQAFRRRQEVRLVEPVELEPAEEMAAFHLGSTVIVLVGRPGFVFDPELVEGQPLQLGRRLGGVPAEPGAGYL